MAGHGYPFPLPLPPPLGQLPAGAPSYVRRRQRRKASQQRRLREAVVSLNAMHSGDAGAMSSSCATTGGLSVSQSAAMAQLRGRVARFQADPEQRSDKAALLQLLKTTDMYDLSSTPTVDFDPEKLNVLQGVAPPRELADRLSGEALDLYNSFATSIERSAEEVDNLRANDLLELPQPHWDPILKGDRAKRISFFRRLHRLGLGGYRRRIRGKIGFFCVKKKDGKQRLVCDGRYPNALHKLPPHTRLGSASALASVSFASEVLTDAAAAHSSPDQFAPAPQPQIASVDLIDCFYQFTIRRMASWFGCEWPCYAWEVKIDCVFNEETGAYEAVGSDEEVFFCFGAMPMGWAWALYFAQSAMESVLSAAIPRSPSGYGGCAKEGHPPPRVAPGWPVSAAYVDNGIIIAWNEADAQDCLKRVRKEFGLRDLVIGDHTAPSDGEVALGLLFNLKDRTVSHTPARAWRLYKSIRALRHIGRATPKCIQVLIGHLVSFFMLRREALVCITRLYAFVTYHTDNLMRPFTKPIYDELKILQGLVFISATKNLDLLFHPVSFCGDASKLGYSLAAQNLPPLKLRDLARHRERWRFKRVEQSLVDSEVTRQGSWEPLKSLDSEFTRWFNTLDLRVGRPRLDRKKPTQRNWEWEYSVGSVPALPAAFTNKQNWHSLIRGAWSFAESIHVLEARVELMGLKRAARQICFYNTALL